jgi:hypothetical protein
LFAGYGQAVEVGGDTVIEAADVFELDVRGGGEGRTDRMKDGGVFGVLYYDQTNYPGDIYNPIRQRIS